MTLPVDLFDRKMIVVTGKGGVGRTVVSCAIALAAARLGKRTCIAELYGQARVPALFGLPGRTYAPQPVTERVDTMSTTPMECLDDFGHRKLKLDALVRAVLTNRIMTAFVDAVPGLHDLLQLGKLENLIIEPLPSDPHYDLMVVDAPATGHGVTLLAAPRTMSEVSRVGPFHDLARIIERTLHDPRRSAVVIVTLPEDLPVNEALELAESLGELKDLVSSVIVNQVRPPAIPEPPAWERVREALDATRDPDLEQLARIGALYMERQRSQAAAMQRVGPGFAEVLGREIAVAEFPRIEPHEIKGDDVHRLAENLLTAEVAP